MSIDFLDQDALVSMLMDFVRFPSEQTDLQESDPAVKAFITDCVTPILREIGIAFRFDGMGNLIAEAGPKEAERSILFLTYAMTHPASNMIDPFQPTIVATERGPAVRGRGVAEQKTALTAAIAAVADAIRGPALNGRLVFALTTAGETGRHDAVESVMAELGSHPTYAVICIGTDNRVAIGNKGRIDFDVTVHGKACHSSAPWNGINALQGAWHLLSQLDALDLGVPDHPDFGPATLTPTAIDSAPKATHTVPDRVRMTFDRRLLPGEDPHQAFADLEKQIALDGPWSLEVALGPVMYPNLISTDGPFFQHLAAAFEKAGAGAAEPFPCSFALDAGYFGRTGTEAVMLGPGNIDQFHSNEEKVLVSDLVTMSRVYRNLIETFAKL